ncbi:hypothetical protein ACFY4C_41330 [Actinomadura viridis]|uniref:class II glutamine amidotransferase n=1 Tax=Actinomadura viridis TaxID=58110 RepID=UPI0036817C34
MCGLFGMLRSPTATHPDHASTVFAVLGKFAEERGLDAAGAAFLHADEPTSTRVRKPASRLIRCPDVQAPGWRVVKACVPFTRLWNRDLDNDLDRAQLVLGHTRWATQGGAGRVVNASPLIVGGLVGTHNGDVDIAPLRSTFTLPRPAGGTDSEVIFQALAKHDPIQVLTRLRGRAALVWADLARPDRVHLARAALSPLAVALDSEENLYWASNPDWLREAADLADVELVSLRLLAEGTLTTVTATPHMQITRRKHFVATARHRDLRLAHAVWRGFTPADRAADRKQSRHAVAGPAWWSQEAG